MSEKSDTPITSALLADRTKFDMGGVWAVQSATQILMSHARTLESRCSRLEAGLQEIFDMLKGDMPITAEVKEIARKALAEG